MNGETRLSEEAMIVGGETGGLNRRENDCGVRKHIAVLGKHTHTHRKTLKGRNFVNLYQSECVSRQLACHEQEHNEEQRKRGNRGEAAEAEEDSQGCRFSGK